MHTQHQNSGGFVPQHGGYKRLMSYHRAEIIYDGTVYFTNRFYATFDRTVGQMVQAARSGKQNIAEGSMASATSKETEIKLTNVARASLEELKIDYEDFLRQHELLRWPVDHRYVDRLRELNRSAKLPGYGCFRKAIEHDDPEICANTMITLIEICTYLLKRQIDRLEADFVAQGGLRERMYNARDAHRRKR